MADTTAGASLSDAPAVFRYSKREHEQTMWVLLVLGLGTGLYGYAAAEEPAMRWIMVGIGALMSLLAAAYLARGFGSAWARSYLVTFDRQGLFCPKLFQDKVPWSAIEHVGLRRTRDLDSYLVVSVPDSVRYPPVPGRALQAASVLKTGDPLSLDVGPLEGTPADIEAAIRHFAPRPVSGPPS